MRGRMTRHGTTRTMNSRGECGNEDDGDDDKDACMNNDGELSKHESIKKREKGRREMRSFAFRLCCQNVRSEKGSKVMDRMIPVHLLLPSVDSAPESIQTKR